MANSFLVSVHESFPQPLWLDRVAPFLQSVMDILQYDGEEISVLFCSDTFMAEMNGTYRNSSGPTDILSFEDGGTYIDACGTAWTCAGDLLISMESVERNASYFLTDPDTELKRVLIHGILHLNGMDHGTEHIGHSEVPQSDMLLLQERTLAACVNTHIIDGV
ncbi:MAG: rRNA maturation RNase YbeY [Treponema sp.]|nr:rRNA maturation RNase YbeY [Treponema sp.]